LSGNWVGIWEGGRNPPPKIPRGYPPPQALVKQAHADHLLTILTSVITADIFFSPKTVS